MAPYFNTTEAEALAADLAAQFPKLTVTTRPGDADTAVVHAGDGTGWIAETCDPAALDWLTAQCAGR